MRVRLVVRVAPWALAVTVSVYVPAGVPPCGVGGGVWFVPLANPAQPESSALVVISTTEDATTHARRGTRARATLVATTKLSTKVNSINHIRSGSGARGASGINIAAAVVVTDTPRLVTAPLTFTVPGAVHVACAGAPVQLTVTLPVKPFMAFTFNA
jgi:hypothetical protein